MSNESPFFTKRNYSTNPTNWAFMGSRKKKVKVTAIEKEEKVEIGQCRGIKGDMD